MTVVAYRSGILAADTALWYDDVIVGHREKIIRLKDGRYFVGSGLSKQVDTYRRWLDGEISKPTPIGSDDDFGALLVDGSEVVCVDASFSKVDVSTFDFFTLGWHREFVLGAMAAGCSADQAVGLAIRYCQRAGGKVQVVSTLV